MLSEDMFNRIVEMIDGGVDSTKVKVAVESYGIQCFGEGLVDGHGEGY